jgi:hypothetical protein
VRGHLDVIMRGTFYLELRRVSVAAKAGT